MSVLVTGGTGCLGYHLLSLLTKSKEPLVSFSKNPPKDFRKLKHVHYHRGNIQDEKHLLEVLSEYKPSEVYHIAAQNSVALSQKQPYLTHLENTMGTQSVLEAVRKVVPKTRFLFISSAEVYGSGKGVVNSIHTEKDILSPVSPFATSKIAGELMVQQYVRAHNLDAVIIRPFHFTGPRQSTQYVLPSIAQQIAQIEVQDGELSLFVGNLDVSRDYLDVRDLARGITMLVNSGNTGEVYNICSGKARPIRELAEQLIRQTGQPIQIHVDPRLERKNDIPLLVGSPDKMVTLTGWKPMISIADSLHDLYQEMKIRLKYL